MKLLGGNHGPGPGPYEGPRRRTGLFHGCFYNLCTAICSCCYVFSCCWLVEDCFGAQRSFPWPAYGSSEPPPPPPPPPPPHRVIGHQHYGPMGSIIDGPPTQPGPYGPPHYR